MSRFYGSLCTKIYYYKTGFCLKNRYLKKFGDKPFYFYNWTNSAHKPSFPAIPVNSLYTLLSTAPNRSFIFGINVVG